MRRRKIYRLLLEDESRLTTIATRSFPAPALIGIIIGVFILSMFAGALLLAFTPLRTLIPGYLRDSQREATEEAIQKIDSLQEVIRQNDIFLNNVRNVFNPDRKSSDSLFYTSSRGSLSADSLLPRSSEEAKFASVMQEREKFNIDVIASLAADGMLMFPISDEGVIAKDSQNSYTVKVSLPSNASVMAIADGVVIGSYYDPALHTYVLLTQHDNGFVSRIEGLGNPFVGQSDILKGGEIVAASPTAKKGSPAIAKVSLWHNGTPVKPYEYIAVHHYNIPANAEVRKTSKILRSGKNKNQSDSTSVKDDVTHTP